MTTLENIIEVLETLEELRKTYKRASYSVVFDLMDDEYTCAASCEVELEYCEDCDEVHYGLVIEYFDNSGTARELVFAPDTLEDIIYFLGVFRGNEEAFSSLVMLN